MGYTVIGSTYHGIEASTRYFVPLGENLEIWQSDRHQPASEPAQLSLFSRSSSACGMRGMTPPTSSAT